MRRGNLKFILILIISFISFFKDDLTFAQLRRPDETSLELEFSSRLESMIEKKIGKERALVEMDVKLSEAQIQTEAISFKAKTRGLPGIAFPETFKRITGISSQIGPLIENISVLVYMDEKLPKDKVELVKANIPKWLDLDFKRGDSLRIELIPWKEVSPEDVAVKQLSFLKRNLWIILIIALALILTIAIFSPFLFGLRKSFKEILKIKPEERKLEEAFKIDSLLGEIRDLISTTGVSPKRTESLLEDIKEIMAKFPKRSDSILEEIRDVLGRISPSQTSGGGVVGPGRIEFLDALKEIITPAVGGGPSLGPEVLEALKKIEGTLRLGISAKEAGEVIDEPFKYLNTLSPREISLVIEGETTRISAIVLAHIDPAKSASVLSNLPLDKQLELSIAMASLVETEEVALEMKEFLKRKLKTIKLYADFTPVTGTKSLADILSSLPYEKTTSILERLEEINPFLSSQIKKFLFLFEDIPKLSDKSVQEILKSIDMDRLALALIRTSEKTREKFFKNMSERTAKMIKEELDTKLTLFPTEGAPEKVILFEDIVYLDNRTLEEVIKTVDKNTLRLALKGASEEIRQKIYSVLTGRGQAMLKEDLEVMPSISRSLCEEAQQKILEVIKKLENRPIECQQEILDKIRQLERLGRISLKVGEKEMI